MRVVSSEGAFSALDIEDSGSLRGFFIEHLARDLPDAALRARLADPFRAQVVNLAGEEQSAGGRAGRGFPGIAAVGGRLFPSGQHAADAGKSLLHQPQQHPHSGHLLVSPHRAHGDDAASADEQSAGYRYCGQHRHNSHYNSADRLAGSQGLPPGAADVWQAPEDGGDLAAAARGVIIY